jgi:capsular polysaccharide transport system permease protein
MGNIDNAKNQRPEPLESDARRDEAKSLRKLQRTREKGRVKHTEIVPSEIEATLLPLLPQRSRRLNYGTLISFILCVVVPSVAASIYYGAYASRQYAAEFRFSVRDAQAAAAVKTSGSIGSQLGIGASSNPLENYMVVQYLTSRDAVDEIQRKLDVVERFSRPDVDWLSRFDRRLPMEKFVTYWKDMVDASYDQVTGIAAAEVRAFTAEDSFLIANTLVAMSEELVNAIATKPQQDAIRFAEHDVKRAEDRLKAVSAELAQFRNTEQVIDPQTNVVSSNALLAQNLRTSLAQLQTELSSLQKQQLGPNAPMSLILQSRIKATREQLAAVEAEISNTRDGASALSKVVGRYEQLDLERQFAQEMVKQAMGRLEEARANAAAQHIYITAFVRPSLPQSSTYPKRLVSVLVVAFGCLLFWTVGLLFVRSVREHIS